MSANPLQVPDADGAKARGSGQDVRANAIYHITEKYTQFELPDVVPHLFADELKRALSPSAPTGLIPLDASATLRTAYPATAPFMLARYVVVRKGESLEHCFQATGEVYCVLRGAGKTTAGSMSIDWRARDVFCVPGAGTNRHEAREDSLLLVVTDEPQLAFLRLSPPDPRHNAAVTPAMWEADKLEERVQYLHSIAGQRKAPGKAVVFTVADQRDMRSILPMMTSSINTLEPGGVQKMHVHNAVSITLALDCEGVFSTIGKERFDWTPFVVVLIPPHIAHSHHNPGSEMMRSITFLDGPLWHAARNSGYRDVESAR